MATKSLGTLTLDLVARTAGFVKGMDAAERKSAKWRRSVQRDVKRVSGALGRTLKIGAVAAAAGLAIVIQRSRETIDAQAKAAQQLRTTSESLANLGRAGQLAGVSMKQIEVAARTLDVNIGKASQGIGLQAKAFEKLKLSADEVSKLPLDQRITAINNALRDNVTETERAAVAADLFGTRNGAAIQQLQPEVIAQAAREVAVFGLNLSDVDAAKVELANDALSTAGVAAQGLGQQLTVAVAPAIRAVGLAFFDYAEEAGGANKLVTDSFGAVVNAVAFAADAADGIGRAFTIAADVAITAISGLAAGAAENLADLISVANTVTFGAFEDAEAAVRQFAATQEGVFAEATKNIRETLERPLIGNALKEGYEQAKLEAQAAAEAAVAARSAAGIPTQGFTPPAPSGGTETPAPGGAANDPVIGSASSQTGGSRFTAIEDEYQTHAENLIAIDAAKNEVLINAGDQLFGSLSGAARTFAGEQSGIYKTLFAVEKAAAIARSIIAVQTAIAQASASAPFPANIAAMAQVAASTAGLISTIASTSIQGQAHDGMMNVPKTGTYLLEQGERVVSAETTKKMDRKLDGVGGGVQVRNINVFDANEVGNEYMGSSDAEQNVMNIVSRNRSTLRSLVG